MDKQKLMQQEAWLLKEKYDGQHTREFETDRLRLHRGEPLAYVIGWVPFLHTTIFLDSYPLIPRVETEHWVAQAIADIEQSDVAKPTILDLCAGSGCIGVSVAHALPEATVDFAELHEPHHATIRKNISENKLRNTGKIYGGDLFDKVEKVYDFILSNPPYIDPALDRTEESVRTFEPHIALYGGHGGMDAIRGIITQAQHHLKDHGALYLEHEPEQAPAIVTLATENGLISETHTDQYEVARYSVLRVAQ